MTYELLNEEGVVIATSSTPISYVPEQQSWLTDSSWFNDLHKVYSVREPAPERKVTRLAFRNRFTTSEKVMLELAALDDPAAPMTQRQQAAAIRVHLADVAASTFIDLNREDTRAGVLSLEAGGLLAEGRAFEILDTPVTPGEAFVQ